MSPANSTRFRFPRFSERRSRREDDNGGSGGKAGHDADAYVSQRVRTEAASLRASRQRKRQDRILRALANDIQERMKSPRQDYMNKHPFQAASRERQAKDSKSG